MSVQQDNRGDGHEQGVRQRKHELLVFLAASVVGIYGLGQGLAGLYERGQQISLLWLAVTGLAFFVLFGQMGRVHDTWPRRPGKAPLRTQSTEAIPDDGSPAGNGK
jgi:hypothetical protein